MGYDGALCAKTKEEFDRYCKACDNSVRLTKPSMEYRSEGDYSVFDFGSVFREVFDALKYEDGIMTRVDAQGDGGDVVLGIPKYDIATKALAGLDGLCMAFESSQLLADFMTVLRQCGFDDDDVSEYWHAIVNAVSEEREGWNDESPASCTVSSPIEAMKRRAGIYRMVDQGGLMPAVGRLVKDHIVSDGPLVLYAIDAFADVEVACDIAKIDTLRLIESW